MPRARKVTADVLEDTPLPGMPLDGDPAPAAARRGPGRPRKVTGVPVKSTGNRGRVPARTAKGRIVSKEAMMAKVYADAYTYASLLHAAWDFKDPECAAVWMEPVESLGGQQRLAALIERLVTIVARNDSMLAAAYNSGIFGEAAIMASLLFPPIKQLWKAHGPNGTGHQDQGEGFDADRYPAYSGAAA